MAQQRVTLRDVAKAAQVSLTAVSFYLHDRPGISSETRQRIREAIDELGYVQRGAVTATSTFIGLIVERLPLSPFADMFYGDVIQGIEVRSRQLGYNVALMTVQSADTLPQLFKLHNDSLAGLVILGGGDYEREVIAHAREEYLPAVLVDTDSFQREIPSIMPDYVQGTYQATRYLLEKGHQRIGFIQGPVKFRSLVERFHGYVCALADAGIAVDTNLVQSAISTGFPNKGYREMLALLDRAGVPDAILCASDRTALGALDALRERKLRPPDDVALIGFDNIAQSSHTVPPLTTVEVHKRELGITAVEMLYRQISGGTEVGYYKILLPTHLVIRESG